jgi:hypothetical protein
VQALEGRVKAVPQLSVNQWLADGLAHPEKYEESLTAAYFLIDEEIVDKPSPGVWEQLEARYLISDLESWPNSRVWFFAAYCNDPKTEADAFSDDDSKTVLCDLCLIYYDVFNAAPMPDDEREKVLRRDALFRIFIMPMLERATPEIKGYSQATFKAWLEVMMKTKGSENSDALASWRAYVVSVPGVKVVSF